MSETGLTLQEDLRRCLAHAPERAWENLVRRIQPPLARIVYRTLQRWNMAGLDSVDEILQDVFLRLASDGSALVRQLAGMEDGAALAYLKVMAANATTGFCRGRSAARRSAARSVSLDELAERFQWDPAAPDARLDETLLLKRIDERLAGEGKGRQIFWLYYRHGMTARAIAAIPAVGLSQKGVESVIYRLTQSLRAELGKEGG